MFFRTDRLLFAKNGEPAEQRQTGVDQRRELAGENHQHLPLHRLPLEEDDALSLLPVARPGFRARFARLVFAARALVLPRRPGREIACLPQLADRLR